MSRDRGWRRKRSNAVMWRRLKDDWNTHYDQMACPCRTDRKEMRRFMNTPKNCSCEFCKNRRASEGPTVQERRHLQTGDSWADE